MTLDLSVVVPVYRNEETLRELHRRVAAALDPGGIGFELIFVNDASPDESAATLDAIACEDPRVRVVTLVTNRGQHLALLGGMRIARGSWTALMDADLQDSPEALAELLDCARSGYDAVFAGRRGQYQSWPRLVTGRVYRGLLRALTGLPADAGAFLVMSARMRQFLLTVRGPRPFIVSMIGCSGLPVHSIPVRRSRRAIGRSAYTAWSRARAGVGAMRWIAWWKMRGRYSGRSWFLRNRIEASPAMPELSSRQIAAHNAYQRKYYDNAVKPRMIPTGSPYIQRHVDELIVAAKLTTKDRIIEIGCGMGRYTIPIAERGFRIEALDLSPILLQRLAAFNGGRQAIPLHPADVMRPPPQLEGRFTAAVGFFALHHMHDLEACFRGMHEMLLDGGRVAFLEPNALNPLYYIQIALTPGMTWRGDRGVAKMRMGLMACAMERAGFVNPAVHRFGFFPPFIANTRHGARVERTLESFSAFERFLPFQIFTAVRG